MIPANIRAQLHDIAAALHEHAVETAFDSTTARIATTLCTDAVHALCGPERMWLDRAVEHSDATRLTPYVKLRHKDAAYAHRQAAAAARVGAE